MSSSASDEEKRFGMSDGIKFEEGKTICEYEFKVTGNEICSYYNGILKFLAKKDGLGFSAAQLGSRITAENVADDDIKGEKFQTVVVALKTAEQGK